MIYITGDCHSDWSRFEKEVFWEQKDMLRKDYVIVTGDFGIWHDNIHERIALDLLAEKPFTILFIDGNHENFDRLLGHEFEEVKWHGGMAKKIRENILYLERGYVFDIDGKKVFTFGGAASYDIKDGILAVDGADRHAIGEDEGKYYRYISENFIDMNDLLGQFRVNRRKYSGFIRIRDWSWWEREMPNEAEMERGRRSLAEAGNKVDFVVTHCAPTEVLAMLYPGRPVEHDPATDYLNEIAHTAQYDKWFFGHYHDNKQIFGKFVLLYEQIIRIV